MANGVIDLIRNGAELQLSRHVGDGVFGSVNRVFVDDVDERYETFRTRGLDTTLRPESPIHTAPVNQTWGLREFAVTDPDGSGLSFCMPIKSALMAERRSQREKRVAQVSLLRPGLSPQKSILPKHLRLKIETLGRRCGLSI
jgi:hypothetical protein